MATENPKGVGEMIALVLTDDQRQFLRCALTDCKSGREDDLKTRPMAPNAARWRAEIETYARIVAGLDSGTLVPDAEIRRLVRELAEANDREEEYERIVFEHDALAALLAKLEAN